jgi:hypothetical protein
LCCSIRIGSGDGFYNAAFVFSLSSSFVGSLPYVTFLGNQIAKIFQKKQAHESLVVQFPILFLAASLDLVFVRACSACLA